MKPVLLPEGWTRPQPEDEVDERHFDFIDEHGWALMSVFDPKGEDPEFTYSTGFIETLDKPEVIVFGLPADTCKWLLNDLGNHIRNDQPLPIDQPIHGLVNSFPVCLLDVDTSRTEVFAEYLCWSHWYYRRNNFPVWQLVWPDANGRFPWEIDCLRGTIDAQPLLGHLKS